MNWLYPRFPLRHLGHMVRTALVGAAVAGCYGAAHDQVSYAISPEYFTKLKFHQFAYADFGWPPRSFAAVVGFLATWWVGMFAGWIVSRAGLVELPPERRRADTIRAFAIVLTVAAVVGASGVLIGAVRTSGGLSGWYEWQQVLGIEDLRAFAIVAHLHAAGYLGALAGLILAVVYVRRCVARTRSAAPDRVPNSAHSST
jgi:hypothetical protein